MDNRATRLLLAAVGALVALAVVAAVVSVVREPSQQPSGSPGRAVQDYVQAVHDRDYEAAADLLAPSSECTTADLEQGFVDRDARIVLVETEVDGGSDDDGVGAPQGSTARVTIEIVRGDDGPVQVEEWAEEHVLRLERVADGWRLTGSPWPAYDCGRSPVGDGR
ncbi:hypothetical protein [Serinicoccus sediminis]|uniref:hypothetical protein n=1 Tax=Serinicoccus sediminis TaxID=2306021 RepID=UPI0013ED851D|nr:hypothetical protein [Serinicoccus sediminis]